MRRQIGGQGQIGLVYEPPSPVGQDCLQAAPGTSRRQVESGLHDAARDPLGESLPRQADFGHCGVHVAARSARARREILVVRQQQDRFRPEGIQGRRRIQDLLTPGAILRGVKLQLQAEAEGAMRRTGARSADMDDAKTASRSARCGCQAPEPANCSKGRSALR